MSDIWWGVFAIGFVVLFFTWVIGIAVKHSRRKAGEVQQIERLMESCPPVITALAAFARRRNSILVTLAGLSETDTEEIRPFDLLLGDLIYLIRRVHFLHTLRSGNSEGEPKFSKKDAEVILAYYAACGDRQLAGLDWIEMLTRIRNIEIEEPNALLAASLVGSPERIELRDLYVDFARLIGSQQEMNVEEVELEVVVAACTPEEQQIVAEELDLESLETPVEDSLERSYQILGVSALSTAAEIKLKHRQLVRAYHPDRLQGMAEDLSELANKRLAEINGAYRLLGENAKT